VLSGELDRRQKADADYLDQAFWMPKALVPSKVPAKKPAQP
jgi:hypothetical protein